MSTMQTCLQLHNERKQLRQRQVPEGGRSSKYNVSTFYCPQFSGGLTPRPLTLPTGEGQGGAVFPNSLRCAGLTALLWGAKAPVVASNAPSRCPSFAKRGSCYRRGLGAGSRSASVHSHHTRALIREQCTKAHTPIGRCCRPFCPFYKHVYMPKNSPTGHSGAHFMFEFFI